MAHHLLKPPVSESQARALRVNDTVTLEGPLFGIRDANQIALFDLGRKTRFDLRGHAAIHTAPNVKKVPVSEAHPAGYAPVCVGTTTSARMERFTRPLVEELGVRLIIGKGGLGPGSLEVFRNAGAAYLAIIGGTAALETTWIEGIEDVDLDDLNPESIWKFRVRGFGPLLVAMDSHGGSLYEAVDRAARPGARKLWRGWVSNSRPRDSVTEGNTGRDQFWRNKVNSPVFRWPESRSRGNFREFFRALPHEGASSKAACP